MISSSDIVDRLKIAIVYEIYVRSRGDQTEYKFPEIPTWFPEIEPGFSDTAVRTLGGNPWLKLGGGAWGYYMPRDKWLELYDLLRGSKHEFEPYISHGSDWIRGKKDPSGETV